MDFTSQKVRMRCGLSFFKSSLEPNYSYFIPFDDSDRPEDYNLVYLCLLTDSRAYELVSDYKIMEVPFTSIHRIESRSEGQRIVAIM